MSLAHRPGSAVSRVLRGVGHALAEDARRHPSTPMHESLALGLGVAPTPRRDEDAAPR